MIIIILLLAIFSGIFATEELIVYTRRVTGEKNPYLTGGGRDAWRIGGGPWHIPDSLNFALQSDGSYAFGHPDPAFVRMMKDAGTKVLRAFA